MEWLFIILAIVAVFYFYQRIRYECGSGRDPRSEAAKAEWRRMWW
jgi:hypothetical protein